MLGDVLHERYDRGFQGKEGAGAIQTAGCAFSHRICRSRRGMCCEILVATARQPCGPGSSSGKDDDQEWAAVNFQSNSGS